MAFLDENGLAELWSRTKEITLSANTAALFGLGKNATADDAFNRIHALFTRSGIPVAVKVVDADGNPAPEGLRISGLYLASGENAATGPDGVAYGSMMENGGTLSVDSYWDVTGSVVVTSSKPNEFTEVTMVVTLVDFKRIDDSTSGRISPWCKKLDVSAIGGGGGGFQLTKNADRTHHGGGGKAGTGIAVEDVLFFPNMEYDVAIGAGGDATAAGGATTLFGLTAAGGASGVNGDTVYTGGDFQLYASLTTTVTVGGHGGGGVYSTDTSAVAVHGSPYGGYGAVCHNWKKSSYTETASTAATGPGGGGGGAVGNGYTTPGTRASAGYKGAAALRMWH